MPIRVAVSGGAGQINYNLLFRIASGELFGKGNKVALHVLEIPQGIEALKGVQMELYDCAFPCLEEVVIGTDPNEVFADIDIALLVGAKPRGPGMERKDLLQDNGKIFIGQGKALSDVAKKNVLVFVVGNPCNTNCLICMHNAPNIPKENFFAMTRLDENRARYQLAHKAGVDLTDVEHATIWGNHSSTQVPDIENVRIKGKGVKEVITDHAWLKGEFVEVVQKRGAQIIKARGKSSAASAANAVIDGVQSIRNENGKGSFFSNCLLSDGNPYGIAPGLIFSFPCRAIGDNRVEIIAGQKWDDFMQEKMKLTEKELLEERDLVKDLLRG